MTDTIPTGTDPAGDRCYRHPDRVTFVHCQRCGRPICGACQTLAPVGVHCPECLREARASTASSRPIGRRVASAVSPGSGRPIVTYSIIAVCVIVFILECVTGLNPLTGSGNSVVENNLAYLPGDIVRQPWTLLTVIFVHASVLHIASNMLSLFWVGAPLERFLGRGRFIALFVISGIGADVGVDYLANAHSPVVGASGAIFGILGALVIFARRMGLRTTQLYVVILINLALGFYVTGIAWQAHVGGLIVGIGVGYLILKTAGVRRRQVQVIGLIAVGMVLLLLLLLNTVGGGVHLNLQLPGLRL